ncbi:MAG: hypothetical protein KIT58_22400, partial [Planctomycetota bacterium]|nr:hypothetical protein [Planctomycetota bacterium]
RWADPEAARPEHTAARLAALRAAVDLVAWGRTPGARAAFARHLGRGHALRARAVRDLVHDLRG